MKNIIFSSIFLVLLTLSACEKDPFDKFDVVYEVEFVSTWSSATHPTDFPSNAHFSPMAVLSHTSNAAVFVEGLTASEGVIEVAETGGTDIIDDEFTFLINQSIGLDKAFGNSFDSPGTDKVNIGVGLGYSTVTVLSMVAPSPDWFVAATTNLLDPQDGMWFDSVIVDAFTYDAGSDTGMTFTASNMPIDTLMPVMQITEGPLTEGGNQVMNMGKFIFTRVQ